MTVEWLVPLTLFFFAVALYLGALSVSITGGSAVRQVLGLVLTLALYLFVWVVLRRPLGVLSGSYLVQLLVPSVLCVLGVPLFARAAFRVFGVRIQRGAASAH